MDLFKTWLAGEQPIVVSVSPRASVVQIPSCGQTRFGPIRLEVGAQSVGRGKRVHRGGSHGHGVAFIMLTLKTDSQEALFPPQAHGSSVGPIQRGSTRWSCSAKRQATCYKRPFEHNFASCAHLRAQVDVAGT